MTDEKPHWNKKDVILSVKDVAPIGVQAVKECIVDALDFVDTRLASAIERKEDE